MGCIGLVPAWTRGVLCCLCQRCTRFSWQCCRLRQPSKQMGLLGEPWVRASVAGKGSGIGLAELLELSSCTRTGMYLMAYASCSAAGVSGAALRQLLKLHCPCCDGFLWLPSCSSAMVSSEPCPHGVGGVPMALIPDAPVCTVARALASAYCSQQWSGKDC